MTEPQTPRHLKRTPTPDTSDEAIAEIEGRVRQLKKAGDPHQNVATLEYLIKVARERPAERRESISLALYGLDSSH